MTVVNRPQLIQAMSDITDHSEAAALADLCIGMAEDSMWRDLTLSTMLTSKSDVTDGTNIIPYPIRFIEPVALVFDDCNWVDFRNPTDALTRFATNSDYIGFLRDSGVYVNPTPASGTPYVFSHYAAPLGLSTTVADNPILLNYPNLYIFACCWKLELIARDVEATAYFEGLYKDELKKVKASDRGIRASGSPQFQR